MARTKATLKKKQSDQGSQIIINPPLSFSDDESPVKNASAPERSKVSSSELMSQTKMFTNLYRRVDDFMSGKLTSYHKLSVTHSVPGKGKRNKKQSIFKTLLEEENCDFEVFVKRIQDKCPWMPKCVPARDIRTIAFVANKIGWQKLINKKLVIDNVVSSVKPFCGSLSKFEPWRTMLIQNKQFEASNGLDILKNAFALIYADYLTQVVKGGYKVMVTKELASFTGFNPALFEDNGRGIIALIGLKYDVVENIFEKYQKMSVKNQRAMKSEVMSYWVDNESALEKLKICKDFQNIFPSLFTQISKIKKKRANNA